MKWKLKLNSVQLKLELGLRLAIRWENRVKPPCDVKHIENHRALKYYLFNKTLIILMLITAISSLILIFTFLISKEP